LEKWDRDAASGGFNDAEKNTKEREHTLWTAKSLETNCHDEFGIVHQVGAFTEAFEKGSPSRS
jgi:hypothetical protein